MSEWMPAARRVLDQIQDGCSCYGGRPGLACDVCVCELLVELAEQAEEVGRRSVVVKGEGAA